MGRCTRFNGSAYFHASKIMGEATFDRVRFNGSAIYNGAIFNRTASFRNTIFNGDVSFNGTGFIGNVNFSDLTFSGKAYFYNTIFSGDANFKDVTFIQYVGFWSAEFHGVVGFSNVIFNGSSEIRNVLICSRLVFGNCKIVKYLNFDSLRFEERGFVDFFNIKYEKDGEIILRSCSLSRFDGTGLVWRQLRIEGCHFEKRLGRAIICEEMQARWQRMHWLPRSNARWDILLQHYETLIAEFVRRDDDRKIYALTHSIFEMRRLMPPLDTVLGRILWRSKNFAEYEKQKFWNPWWAIPMRLLLHVLKRYFSLPALYRIVSFYGGSVLMPAMWLLILTFGFGKLYQILIYCSGNRSGRYLDGLSLAFNNIAFSRSAISMELDFSNISGYAALSISVLGVLQVLLTAIVTTMLVFSVRRRFKH